MGNFFAGPLADALGRKPVVVGSMALYGAAAIASALSPSLTVLFISRFVWGFTAAGPRTLSQAMVRDRYSGRIDGTSYDVDANNFLSRPDCCSVDWEGFS